MGARRRIAAADGHAALGAWLGGATDRKTTATAVRFSLEELAERAPGNSVEVRVPPFGVTQCIEGPRHTRGTPPNVVECDGATWLALVAGTENWSTAVESGRVSASGLRAELADLLPLFAPEHGATGSR
ncbi:MAG TPA: sterol carrier family protein [Arthrobacter sp.]|nr:sterol carrier family protein [Arthrobacter sp.]